tara:strand:+ start:579 stop:803 length:225 start_codon:yes stop_codon:yes gene_type:complete
MENVLTELVLQAPWGVAILVVVMAFLRHLARYNESMTSALKQNSDAICQVAKALAKLEERVESMHQEMRERERQ